MSNVRHTSSPPTPEQVFGVAHADPEGTVRGRRPRAPAARISVSDVLERLRAFGSPRAETEADPTGKPRPATCDEATARHVRVDDDLEPAPLPPSPAAPGDDSWFDSVPTNPAAPPRVIERDAAPESRPLATDADAIDTRSIVRVSRRRAAAPLVASQPAWFLPALWGATCLCVGMVLGALLF